MQQSFYLWKFTSSVLVAGFAHLETGSNRSRQTKDDARRIGDYERPVALLFEKPVSNPHRAVDECDERLNPVSLMTGQISKDLRDIGDIHTDGQTGGNHADDAHLFFLRLPPQSAQPSLPDALPQLLFFFNTSSILCSLQKDQ